MDAKVLFVDDESNVLSSMKRQLRNRFAVTTALGPEKGLDAVLNHGPFAVIVSDLRMPVMDGIAFLARAREMSPDSVRMVLSGNADLADAIQAVNQGNIFRFLVKPCASDDLVKVLEQGIAQYRLVAAEKELLEKTLKGSIEVLCNMLSMARPDAFGRSSRIKRYVCQIAEQMSFDDVWKVETGAMLSQIGWIVLPHEVLDKVYRGQELNGEEQQLFAMQPTMASELLDHIPRIEEISRIIAYQEKHYDGGGIPKDGLREEDIPLGARILKAVLDYDILEMQGIPKANALLRMKKRQGVYDPRVLKAFETIFGVESKYAVKDLPVAALAPHMVLGQDMRTATGVLLITKGNEINEVLVNRIKMIAEMSQIVEPLRVFVPVQL